MKRTISLFLALTLLLCACGKKDTVVTWQEQYDLGVRYLTEGNYEQAILAFEAAIEIDPKRADAYIGLAEVYNAQGDTEKAAEILDRAIAELGTTAELTAAKAALAAPSPSPEPTLEPTPESAPEPAPTLSPEPTPEPAPEHTPESTTEPAPTPAPEPTPEPTPTASSIVAHGTCGSNLVWELSDANVLTISGSGPMEDFSFVPYGSSAPWSDEYWIEEVIISEGVTSIGDWAFHTEAGLKKVTIPSSILTIGQGAFRRCALDFVLIPNGVVEIKVQAFEGCAQLRSITFADTVISIGCDAFKRCSALSEIILPSSLERLKDEAFGHCTMLTSAVFVHSPVSFPEYAFEHPFLGCENLTIYGPAGSTVEEYAKNRKIPFVVQ